MCSVNRKVDFRTSKSQNKYRHIFRQNFLKFRKECAIDVWINAKRQLSYLWYILLKLWLKIGFLASQNDKWENAKICICGILYCARILRTISCQVSKQCDKHWRTFLSKEAWKGKFLLFYKNTAEMKLSNSTWVRGFTCYTCALQTLILIIYLSYCQLF